MCYGYIYIFFFLLDIPTLIGLIDNILIDDFFQINNGYTLFGTQSNDGQNQLKLNLPIFELYSLEQPLPQTLMTGEKDYQYFPSHSFVCLPLSSLVLYSSDT